MKRAAFLLLLFLPLPASASPYGNSLVWRGPFDEHLAEWQATDEEDRINYGFTWPYWFEQEKESLLADRMREQRKEHWYPLTDEAREEVARPVLVKSLDSLFHADAVIALGKLGGKLGGEASIVKLVELLEECRTRMFRQEILTAIGLCRHRDSVGILETELHRDPPRYQSHGVTALALGLADDPAARNVLLSRYRLARRQRGRKELAMCIAVSLGVHGKPEDVPFLVERLDPKKDRSLAMCVGHALGRIGGKNARNWLLRTAAGRDHWLAASAVAALGNFPERRVARFLLGNDGLRSGFPRQRMAAIRSLARIAPGLSAPTRRAVLADLNHRAVRPARDLFDAMHGTLNLALIGDPSAAVAQDRLIFRPRPGRWRGETRTAVIMAHGLLRTRALAGPIRGVLRDPKEDGEVRGYAAFSLGLMGDPKGMESVRELLGKTSTPAAIVRGGCWAVGLAGSDEDLHLLLRILSTHPRNDARGAAAIAISLIGGRPALDGLVKVMAHHPHDEVTRAAALAAIGRLVDRAPSPRIANLLAGTYGLYGPWTLRRLQETL